jgi:hypothetical protein
VTIETEGDESEASLVRFIETVESTLRLQNVEYAAKRDSHRLAPPVLLVIAAGSFDRRRAAMTAERNRGDAQYKLPTLTRELLERSKLQITLAIDLPQ